jgi:tetratricopeptide (TPR) repeat protein
MGLRSHTVMLLLSVLGGAVPCRRPAIAEPYIPADDTVVLERLPLPARDPRARQLRALRTELARRPEDLGLATRVAWSSIEQGRRLADPRYYGYAESALSPWWAAAEPPVPVLVLRATIRQHDHDFTGALADLAKALRAEPDNLQAWLTRAVVLQVRGRYAQARSSCLQVLQGAGALVAVTCVSGVDSLSGAAAASYDRLHRALAQVLDADAETRRWALTTLAEIAARLGRPDAAEHHFRQALAMDTADDYLLGAYADFLLDQHRPDAVHELLGGTPQTDGVLLRLALADKMAGAPALAMRRQELEERFAAARLRGDSVHRREQARFALHVLDAPAAALDLALENWAVQREPSDARLLLEAALATGRGDAAKPVIRFLARARLEDVQLAMLAARWREGRP